MYLYLSKILPLFVMPLGVALFLLVFQDMHRLGNRMERRARGEVRADR